MEIMIVILFIGVVVIGLVAPSKPSSPIKDGEIVKIAVGNITVKGVHQYFVFVDRLGRYEASQDATLKESVAQYCQGRGIEYSDTLYGQAYDILKDQKNIPKGLL